MRVKSAKRRVAIGSQRERADGYASRMHSVLDVFHLSIGPSGVHTLGPMVAAHEFVVELEAKGLLARTERVSVQLFGTLATTGRGNGAGKAVLLGLEGLQPDKLRPSYDEACLEGVRRTRRLRLLGHREISFEPLVDLLSCTGPLDSRHSAGLRFTAFDSATTALLRVDFLSFGNGEVVRIGTPRSVPTEGSCFASAQALRQRARCSGLTLCELLLRRERAWRSEWETRTSLAHIAQLMEESIERGITGHKSLPGVLRLKRRASELVAQLARSHTKHEHCTLDWARAFAIAVAEDNASGGRVIQAPGNGAAGVVAAVLACYRRFEPRAGDEGIVRFLLIAGALALLLRSGPSSGCQGEVGVASAMAAGGYVAALEGGDEQIEAAAARALSEHVGLTCDPISGLVQVPCIDRNASAAATALAAARSVLQVDGASHDRRACHDSLDEVKASMDEAAHAMSRVPKARSLSQVAVNVTEC